MTVRAMTVRVRITDTMKESSVARGGCFMVYDDEGVCENMILQLEEEMKVAQ